MNERGDVRGYLRVAVQAVLGREEETVKKNFSIAKIHSFIALCNRWITLSVSVSPPGLPSQTPALVGRKNKEAKVRISPKAPCTAPNQSERLKTYHPQLPKILPLGVEIVHPRKHAQTHFFWRHLGLNRYMLTPTSFPNTKGVNLYFPLVTSYFSL